MASSSKATPLAPASRPARFASRIGRFDTGLGIAVIASCAVALIASVADPGTGIAAVRSRGVRLGAAIVAATLGGILVCSFGVRALRSARRKRAGGDETRPTPAHWTAFGVSLLLTGTVVFALALFWLVPPATATARDLSSGTVTASGTITSAFTHHGHTTSDSFTVVVTTDDGAVLSFSAPKSHAATLKRLFDAETANPAGASCTVTYYPRTGIVAGAALT